MKFILPLLLLSVTTFAQSLTDRQTERIDSVFSRFNKTGSPGCAVGVIRDGQMVFQRGYGMADLQWGQAITPVTVFDIGSTSKQFTAAALILLQQQGKLSLDDDVRKHIPELPDYGKTITIRHLLNHTSGLKDYAGLLSLAGHQGEEVTTNQQALDIIVRQKTLNFTTGEKWDYSNSGFFLASVIVERVSGMSLKSFARQQIFGPLGMNNTFFLDDHRTIVPLRATGYFPAATGFQMEMSNWEQVGDGAVQTSIQDLYRWDLNFYDPKVGGNDMISQLTTPGTLSNGSKLDYALGLFVTQYMGRTMIHHGGAWAGYRAEFVRLPSEKLSVICLSNLGSANPSALAKSVVQICLNEKTKTGTPSPAPASASVDTSPFAGSYRSESNDAVRKLITEAGKLFMLRGSAKVELSYSSENTFIVPGAATFRFVRSGGLVTTMDIIQDGFPNQHFIRFDPVTINESALKTYVGNYPSEELGITGLVTLTGGKLNLKFGTESQSLESMLPDIFYSNQGISIEFTRDKNKKITGFYFSASRTRRIYFSRG
jgi:CubicO group peptidase (beta-lactamase class C family)